MTSLRENKLSVMARLFFMFLGMSFFSFLTAETFSWQARLHEPSFVVDVPSFWLRDYQQQTKGYAVNFFLQDSQMLLHSEKHKEELSLSQLLSAEASRLALTFDYLTFQKKGQLSHREQVQYVSYLGYQKKTTYNILVFFLVANKQSLTLTCSIPQQKYSAQRVVCENAAYSFDFSTKAIAKTAPQKPTKQIPAQKEPKIQNSFKNYLEELVAKVSKQSKKKPNPSSQENKSNIKDLKITED